MENEEEPPREAEAGAQHCGGHTEATLLSLRGVQLQGVLWQ